MINCIFCINKNYFSANHCACLLCSLSMPSKSSSCCCFCGVRGSFKASRSSAINTNRHDSLASIGSAWYLDTSDVFDSLPFRDYQCHFFENEIILINMSNRFNKEKTPIAHLLHIPLAIDRSEFNDLTMFQEEFWGDEAIAREAEVMRTSLRYLPCHGVIGVVQMVMGYYLIIITSVSPVARILSKRVFQIDTLEAIPLYICHPVPELSFSSNPAIPNHNGSNSLISHQDYSPVNIQGSSQNSRAEDLKHMKQHIEEEKRCRELLCKSLEFLIEGSQISYSFDLTASLQSQMSQKGQYSILKSCLPSQILHASQDKSRVHSTPLVSSNLDSSLPLNDSKTNKIPASDPTSQLLKDAFSLASNDQFVFNAYLLVDLIAAATAGPSAHVSFELSASAAADEARRRRDAPLNVKRADEGQKKNMDAGASNACDLDNNTVRNNNYIRGYLPCLPLSERREVDSRRWFLPVICGAVKQRAFILKSPPDLEKVNGEVSSSPPISNLKRDSEMKLKNSMPIGNTTGMTRVLHVAVICRRSRIYFGPRYLKRGVVQSGHVANEVECEQVTWIAEVNDRKYVNHMNHIYAHHSNRSNNHNNFHLSKKNKDIQHSSVKLLSSHVIFRGSIPLKWGHNTSGAAFEPSLMMFQNSIDPNGNFAKKHFIDLENRYGLPIQVVNLIRQNPAHQESIIGLTFKRLIEKTILTASLNYQKLFKTHKPSQLPPIELTLSYFDPDWLAMEKRLGFSLAFRCLLELARTLVSRTGCFLLSMPNLPSEHHSVSKEEKGLYNLSEDSKRSEVAVLQSGVSRVNCIDCLDRTNLMCMCIGLECLVVQLGAFGFGISSTAKRNGDGRRSIDENIFSRRRKLNLKRKLNRKRHEEANEHLYHQKYNDKLVNAVEEAISSDDFQKVNEVSNPLSKEIKTADFSESDASYSDDGENCIKNPSRHRSSIDDNDDLLRQKIRMEGLQIQLEERLRNKPSVVHRNSPLINNSNIELKQNSNLSHEMHRDNFLDFDEDYLNKINYFDLKNGNDKQNMINPSPRSSSQHSKLSNSAGSSSSSLSVVMDSLLGACATSPQDDLNGNFMARQYPKNFDEHLAALQEKQDEILIDDHEFRVINNNTSNRKVTNRRSHSTSQSNKINRVQSIQAFRKSILHSSASIVNDSSSSFSQDEDEFEDSDFNTNSATEVNNNASDQRRYSTSRQSPSCLSDIVNLPCPPQGHQLNIMKSPGSIRAGSDEGVNDLRLSLSCARDDVDPVVATRLDYSPSRQVRRPKNSFTNKEVPLVNSSDGFILRDDDDENEQAFVDEEHFLDRDDRMELNERNSHPLKHIKMERVNHPQEYNGSSTRSMKLMLNRSDNMIEVVNSITNKESQVMSPSGPLVFSSEDDGLNQITPFNSLKGEWRESIRLPPDPHIFKPKDNSNMRKKNGNSVRRSQTLELNYVEGHHHHPRNSPNPNNSLHNNSMQSEEEKRLNALFGSHSNKNKMIVDIKKNKKKSKRFGKRLSTVDLSVTDALVTPSGISSSHTFFVDPFYLNLCVQKAIDTSDDTPLSTRTDTAIHTMRPTSSQYLPFVIAREITDLWAEIGNVVSMQYASTPAMHRPTIKPYLELHTVSNSEDNAKRHNQNLYLTPWVADKAGGGIGIAFDRYIAHKFHDQKKQVFIDLLLGRLRKFHVSFDDATGGKNNIKSPSFLVGGGQNSSSTSQLFFVQQQYLEQNSVPNYGVSPFVNSEPCSAMDTRVLTSTASSPAVVVRSYEAKNMANTTTSSKSSFFSGVKSSASKFFKSILLPSSSSNHPNNDVSPASQQSHEFTIDSGRATLAAVCGQSSLQTSNEFATTPDTAPASSFTKPTIVINRDGPHAANPLLQPAVSHRSLSGLGPNRLLVSNSFSLKNISSINRSPSRPIQSEWEADEDDLINTINPAVRQKATQKLLSSGLRTGSSNFHNFDGDGKTTRSPLELGSLQSQPQTLNNASSPQECAEMGTMNGNNIKNNNVGLKALDENRFEVLSPSFKSHQNLESPPATVMRTANDIHYLLSDLPRAELSQDFLDSTNSPLRLKTPQNESSLIPPPPPFIQTYPPLSNSGRGAANELLSCDSALRLDALQRGGGNAIGLPHILSNMLQSSSIQSANLAASGIASPPQLPSPSSANLKKRGGDGISMSEDIIGGRSLRVLDENIKSCLSHAEAETIEKNLSHGLGYGHNREFRFVWGAMREQVLNGGEQ